MTIEEEIVGLLERIFEHFEDLQKDIDAFAKDPSNNPTPATIKNYFDPQLSVLKVYLKRIEDLLGRKMFAVVEMEKIHLRYDRLEAAVRANTQEIEALKKKLQE